MQLLRDHESRNIVFADPDGSWPIVWERAKGVHVWGADGQKYLDLTAAFGVAAAGHTNTNVVKAGQKQMARLLHAMGDVHPHARKAELARELSRITFERWTNPQKFKTGKVIFNNSGFEAVEAALKTAMLATGKSGVIAFTGAYHGLGYGALNATHREFFRGPFRSQLRRFGHFVLFPKNSADLALVESQVRSFFRHNRIGAILVEPVQARGGINVPPKEFLPLLRKLCGESGALLILDEIYTGFGRTGKWFACEHSGVVPDLICLGKALTGGFPLSACVGRADLMDAAWPESRGEAIHTSTFLGHPVGCAMALAQISEIKKLSLPERAAELGKFLLAELSKVQSSKFKVEARGLGLLAGIELRRRDDSPATVETFGVIKKMLSRGFILLPEGEHGNVISFTPPLTITQAQLAKAVKALAEVLK
ncbi:MAG TPA: aspartate aminotransferase family protein [Candidatus Aquilonibacter sp.]|nr:aspartate aminotransferase family protein [Candidatus Aquilonibacter sp.]